VWGISPSRLLQVDGLFDDVCHNPRTGDFRLINVENKNRLLQADGLFDDVCRNPRMVDRRLVNVEKKN
jgi:hypothetical protein